MPGVQAIAVRAMWLVFALCLTLPLLSFWVPSDVPSALKVLVAALLAASVFRPVAGIFSLAILGPLAVPLVVASGTPPFGGNEALEAMVLAVLAGIALRWTVRGPLECPTGGRLTAPSLLFGAVVMSSAVTLLGVQQLISEPLPTFLRTCWTHITQNYFSEGRAFPAWHEAAVWIEALLLALMIERVVRRSPGSGRILALAAACGLAVEAGFSLLRLGQIAARSGDVANALWQHALTTRISPHFPDVNAIGSLFALGAACWITIALGPKLSLWARAGALVGASVMGAALWLTGSRAALGATAIVAVLVWLVRQRPSRGALAAALTAAGALALAFVTIDVDMAPRATAATAVRIRIEMAQVGVQMARDRPWFGVGLSEFSRQSTEYISPDLAARFPPAAYGENAHNQLVQILGELGGIGLMAFLWYWIRVLWPAFGGLRSAASSPWLWALTAGLCAFHLSALLGHPFLTPYVVFSVFIFVGLVGGLTAAERDPRRRWPLWLAVAASLALTISVPWRVTEAAVASGNVVIGASAVVGELDGIRYRVAAASSSWFVPAPARMIIVPLRASANSRGSCAVRITMDGTPANELMVDGQAWQHVRLFIEALKEVGSHRLDLHTSSGLCVLLVGQIQRR